MAEVTKVAKPLLAAEKRLKHHGGKELDDIIGSYSELPESDTCSTDSESKLHALKSAWLNIILASLNSIISCSFFCFIE